MSPSSGSGDGGGGRIGGALPSGAAGNRQEVAPPLKLTKLIRAIEAAGDRQERIQLLIDVARRYHRVSSQIANPPYPDEFKVPACESQAYVFPEANDDGTLTFHFAVENPQGVSAMAMAAILGDTLSGAPLEQVVAVSPEIVYQIFGRELSMGKNMGLSGMVSLVKRFAQTSLERRNQTSGGLNPPSNGKDDG
jgi:cysteine desulfuration protein SufE